MSRKGCLKIKENHCHQPQKASRIWSGLPKERNHYQEKRCLTILWHLWVTTIMIKFMTNSCQIKVEASLEALASMVVLSKIHIEQSNCIMKMPLRIGTKMFWNNVKTVIELSDLRQWSIIGALVQLKNLWSLYVRAKMALYKLLSLDHPIWVSQLDKQLPKRQENSHQMSHPQETIATWVGPSSLNKHKSEVSYQKSSWRIYATSKSQRRMLGIVAKM